MKTFSYSFRPLNIFIQAIGINHFYFPWNSLNKNIRLKPFYLFSHLTIFNLILVSTAVIHYNEIDSLLDEFRVYFVCFNIINFNLHRIMEIKRRNYLWSAMRELHQADVMVSSIVFRY